MSISWGNSAVRVYAAEAWVSLASRFAAEYPGLADQLEIILSDPAPAVRLQVAENLHVIYAAAPERMWTMAERFVSVEPEVEIVVAYLNRSMWHLTHADPGRCEAMLDVVIRRFGGGDLGCGDRGRTYLLESIGGLAAQLFAGQGRARARTWLDDWTADIRRYGELLGFFTSHLRAAFFHRYDTSTEPDAGAMCDRAQAALAQILASATAISASAYRVHASDPGESEKEAARERYGEAEKLIHHAMSQLYFGSGAHGRDREDGPGLPNPAAMRQFLTDYHEVLALFACTREPGTLHHLIELYEFLIPGDPVTVFDEIHAILLGRGAEEGYHYESLGNTAVVGVVQRYIADYRSIFEDEERRARLVAILRLFSQAGWPEALKLLYELPELLR
jgi:hypothetical protein